MMKWTETIEIAAPAERVFKALHDQAHVMGWSAWPEATGFTCAVVGDGVSPGSEIVFRNGKGVVQGRQRIISTDGTRVLNRMENRGPFGRTITPTVDFEAIPIDDRRTRVSLDFAGQVPLPPGLRHVVEAVMSRWVRRLHVKDLMMLKEYVETGRVDATRAGH